MQSTTRQVVVAAKTEDLRFTCTTGVCGQMQNLFGIAHKGWTHERALVCGPIDTSDDLVVTASKRINDTRGAVGGNALDQLGRQRRGNVIHARLDGGCIVIDCHGMLLRKDAQTLTTCSTRLRLWQKSAPKMAAMAGSAILR